MDKLTKMDFDHMLLEWDEEKERLNFSKHRIHFRTAAKIFRDPNLMIREDQEHPHEKRFDVLGKVEKVLFVVCTLRHANTIRLISARLATIWETEQYENGENEFE